MRCSCCSVCKKNKSPPIKLNKLTHDYLGNNNEIDEHENNKVPKCFYISLHDIYIFIKDKVNQKHKTD